MPLVIIWRKPKIVDNVTIIPLRNLLNQLVAEKLKTKINEVEVRIRDMGDLDINWAPVGIEIETGPGKDRWRIMKQQEIGKEIAEEIFKSGLLSKTQPSGEKSYVWLKIFESAFVPIGYPDKAR